MCDRALSHDLNSIASGINFATYEALRGVITPPGKSGAHRKLACGALAGSISQTLTYPFDVLRRKMQVTGLDALGYKYNGALDALQSIVRNEGVRGLYRGLWPNLRKFSILQACVISRADGNCSEGCAEHCHVFLYL